MRRSPRHLGFTSKLVVMLLAIGIFFFSGSTCLAQRNFRRADSMVLTYLFAWYDVNTNEQIVDNRAKDYLSVHPAQTAWFDHNPVFTERKPPSITGSPKFSYREPAWFAQQLQQMQTASIDVMAFDYWAGPQQVARSKTGAENLNRALLSTNPNISVCLFLESAGFLNDTNLGTEAGNDKVYQAIRDFYSRIDRRFWVTLEGQVPVILYTTGVSNLVITDAGMQRIRQKFRTWSGLELCFLGNDSWKAQAPTAIRYSCSWGAAVRANKLMTKDLMQVSPGQNYRGTRVTRSLDGYRSAWELARSTRPSNWIAIETWSEFNEATAIAPTAEEGNAFLQVTQSQARRFKNRQ